MYAFKPLPVASGDLVASESTRAVGLVGLLTSLGGALEACWPAKLQTDCCVVGGISAAQLKAWKSRQTENSGLGVCQ